MNTTTNFEIQMDFSYGHPNGVWGTGNWVPCRNIVIVGTLEDAKHDFNEFKSRLPENLHPLFRLVEIIETRRILNDQEPEIEESLIISDIIDSLVI